MSVVRNCTLNHMVIRIATCKLLYTKRKDIKDMINTILKITGIILLLTGGVLLYCSIDLPMYHNATEFNEKYMELKSGERDSSKFHQLRSEYLTPKHKLEDYGMTSILAGFILITVSVIKIEKIRSPKSWEALVILGIFNALLTILAFIGDLFLEMDRDSYPPWADSLGIPLLGTPILLVMALAWALVNLVGTKKNFSPCVPLLPIELKLSKKWYLIISLITIGVIVMTIVDGYFWQLGSGFLWLYFYLSIMQGFKEFKKIKSITEANIIR